MTSHDPLGAITGGDRALATVLRSVLQHLSDSDQHGGEKFGSVAREILAGTLDPREIARTSLLERSVLDQIDNFHRWQTEVGADEVQRQLETARHNTELISQSDQNDAGSSDANLGNHPRSATTRPRRVRRVRL